MFIYVPGMHICFWCVPLYLVCTFVFGVYLVSFVQIHTWCAHLYLVACLYLVYTLVSDVHLCIWCACLYLVCIFVSGVHVCIRCAHLHLMFSYLLSTTLLYTQAWSYSETSILVTCPLCLCQTLEQLHQTTWQEL
jgi:hypothetical protein